MSKPLADASKGEVNIHGKIYLTVARRIDDFRKAHPDYSIVTHILHADYDYVQVRAEIANEQGRVIATGIAEEVRKASNINKTSAVENAETSAVGRALAFLGMGGTEIASANEVADAISQQKSDQASEYLMKHNEVLRDSTVLMAVAQMKESLASDDYGYVAQVEAELEQEELAALWVAPSKGGVFTTEERTKLRSDEMNSARKSLAQGGQ
jgi:deoxycytidylate deaminase